MAPSVRERRADFFLAQRPNSGTCVTKVSRIWPAPQDHSRPSSTLKRAIPAPSSSCASKGRRPPTLPKCVEGTGVRRERELTSCFQFLVDATISRVSSAVFFGGGTAHQGELCYHQCLGTPADTTFCRILYRPLSDYGRRCGWLRRVSASRAPSLNALDSPGDPNSPITAGQITKSLRHVASEMSRGTKDPAPIPLWVTGHSLGSALASLIYARYLRMPSDLGKQIQLRDCYTFGSGSCCHSARGIDFR